MKNSKSLSSFRKLPNRYTSIVLPFLLSIIMTFVVSMISTLRSLGLEEFSLYMDVGMGNFLDNRFSNITFSLTDRP